MPLCAVGLADVQQVTPSRWGLMAETKNDELFSEEWISQLVDALTEVVIAHPGEQAPTAVA